MVSGQEGEDEMSDHHALLHLIHVRKLVAEFVYPAKKYWSYSKKPPQSPENYSDSLQQICDGKGLCTYKCW